MKLKIVTYTSRARLDLSDLDLADIHESARHLNALDGISGMLVFDGVRFLQVIEGAEEAIDDLIARLRLDPRHSAFEIRDERPSEARIFPDWSMELVRVSDSCTRVRDEVESRLPQAMPDEARRRILDMAGGLSGT